MHLQLYACKPKMKFHLGNFGEANNIRTDKNERILNHLDRWLSTVLLGSIVHGLIIRHNETLLRCTGARERKNCDVSAAIIRNLPPILGVITALFKYSRCLQITNENTRRWKNVTEHPDLMWPQSGDERNKKRDTMKDRWPITWLNNSCEVTEIQLAGLNALW